MRDAGQSTATWLVNTVCTDSSKEFDLRSEYEVGLSQYGSQVKPMLALFRGSTANELGYSTGSTSRIQTVVRYVVGVQIFFLRKIVVHPVKKCMIKQVRIL